VKRLLVTQRVFDDTFDDLGDDRVSVDVRDSDEPMGGDALSALLRDYDGVVCMLTDRIDDAVLERNAHLEVVSNVAVGFDNIDVRAAHRLGIVVTNTPDVLTETTADLTMALMLAVARRIPEADTFVRSGAWQHWTLLPDYAGTDLHGKVLGLFGMGRIAKAVARRARHGFGMQVLYTSRSEQRVVEGGVEGERVDLDELLRRSDVLSIHAPLTPQTRGAIGTTQLAAMKPSAILINTARGALVDEAALAEALEQGRLWGAGLDVFAAEPRVEPRLLQLRERVVLAPHIGSATVQCRRMMARTAAVNACRVLAGGSAPNAVSV
jgi:glyoxylate reductase